MQAVQQRPKLGERRRRGQRSSDCDVEIFRWIGNPRGKSSNGSVGELAKDIFPFGKLNPPLHLYTLSVERVKRILNGDSLGTMGIMFLSRRAAVRVT
jgi:hypothetical protein